MRQVLHVQIIVRSSSVSPEDTARSLHGLAVLFVGRSNLSSKLAESYRCQVAENGVCSAHYNLYF